MINYINYIPLYVFTILRVILCSYTYNICSIYSEIIYCIHKNIHFSYHFIYTISKNKIQYTSELKKRKSIFDLCDYKYII